MIKYIRATVCVCAINIENVCTAKIHIGDKEMKCVRFMYIFVYCM